jgi:uncharacterized FlaG/YvyC family protein
MVKIIKFPTKPVREWACIEKGLHKTLSDAQADKSMISHICKKMKKHYEKYNVGLNFNLNLDLPSSAETKEIEKSVEASVESFGKQIRKLMGEVFTGLLMLEIELYGLKRLSTNNSGA